MIGNRIKELRIKRNLSRAALASLLNVSGATITMWENGQRHPEITKLVEISKLFNVTIDWLLSPSDLYVELKLPNTENSITLLGRNGLLKTYIVDDSQIKTLKSFTDTLTGQNNDV